MIAALMIALSGVSGVSIHQADPFGWNVRATVYGPFWTGGIENREAVHGLSDALPELIAHANGELIDGALTRTFIKVDVPLRGLCGELMARAGVREHHRSPDFVRASSLEVIPDIMNTGARRASPVCARMQREQPGHDHDVCGGRSAAIMNCHFNVHASAVPREAQRAVPHDFQLKPWSVRVVRGVGGTAVFHERADEKIRCHNSEDHGGNGKPQVDAAQPIGLSYLIYGGPLGTKIGIAIAVRVLAVWLIWLGWRLGASIHVADRRSGGLIIVIGVMLLAGFVEMASYG